MEVKRDGEMDNIMKVQLLQGHRCHGSMHSAL